MSVVAELKSTKSHMLRQQLLSNGYACFLFTVEVGCLGNYKFVSPQNGFSEEGRRLSCKMAALTALRCSNYIYRSRKKSVWRLCVFNLDFSLRILVHLMFFLFRATSTGFSCVFPLSLRFVVVLCVLCLGV
jgi:hypothetical protein